ncbi:MAG: YicC family protein [Ruminococcaceae bacterium]|nr:YicC family protein [Oscillospiraceae bacterium]
MIRSMTGFGRCRMTVEGLDITVEIKSVNSRFLDCNTKISRAYGYLEERVKPYLLSRGVSRGKVDVWISVESLGAEAADISLDEGYLRGYLAALHTLRDSYGLRDDISVMSVAANRDVFLVKKPEEDIERDWSAVKTALDAATDVFLEVRRREGESLAADMRAKLENLRSLVDRIEQLSQACIGTYRERLAQRIREALADNLITPDETRLLTECAIYADKVAIDEETVRLRTHFEAFEKILADGDAVGRRLDFLLQEMNREVNTTGSKCSDAAIAALVVDAKCELEKIREQIQNLE